ncbi:MAG: hypothetical protein WD226_10750 [Planctomycetota bacterium]
MKRARPFAPARPGRFVRAAWRGVLLATVVIVLVGIRHAAERLERRATADGLGRVDPSVLATLEFPAWADRRWTYEYEDLLTAFGEFEIDDVHALAALRESLEALSFVREVHRLEAVWPDELVLDLSLWRPVACVPVAHAGEGPTFFRAVSADGTLLTGFFERPPRVDDGWLPVLGPLDDRELLTLCSLGRAGDYLATPEHLDALDVALSLETSLAPAARERLGRIVIDASRARYASPEEPGIRLDLEDRRRVLFGRAPSAALPGERPVAAKWRSIADGLERFGDPRKDWDVLDVRWDVPDVWLRNEALADAGSGSSHARPY